MGLHVRRERWIDMRRVGDEAKTIFLERQALSTKNLYISRRAAEANDEWRLNLMIKTKRISGWKLDSLYALSLGTSDSAFRQLMGKLSNSPS